jgi:hypothetical protein
MIEARCPRKKIGRWHDQIDDFVRFVLTMQTEKLKRCFFFHSLSCVATVICILQALAPSAQCAQPSFAAPPISAVGGPKVGLGGFFSMAKGDFNNDGIPDFAVVGFACANPGGDAVTIYLGNGDGTFQTPVSYAVPGACPYDIVVGRLRGKNAPEDLVLVDEGSTPGITVLLGNGDGTFQSPTAIALPTTPTAAAVGDFNGDGKLDIAVSLFGGSGQTGGNFQSLAILIGHGDGTFDPAVLYQSLENPYGISVGDFNNDGKPDIVVRNPEALALSLGNGDGTFKPGYVILTEPSTLISVNPPGPILNGLVSVAIADFNGDGNLDIAAAEDGERVDVLLGTGTGAFLPPVTYLNNQHQTGSGGGQIAAAKLSNSGHIDLVINTGYGTTLGIFRGNGDGTFQTTPVVYPLPQYDDEGMIVADVNNDGRPDIVVGTMGGRGIDPNFLTVLLNKGNGDFGAAPLLFSVKSQVNQGTATNAVGVALADLTGNNKQDLITTDWDVPIEPAANGQIPVPPTIDVNNMTVDTHGSISVLAGNGDGTFQAEKQYYVGGRPIAVQAADLTGDGKKDLVVVNAFDSTLSILKGNGDYTFQPAITIPVGKNPNAVVLADFNGDGKADIAATNLVDNSVSVVINQSSPGNLSFKTAVTYPVGTYPAGIVARDFNHDGKLDLAVINAGNSFGSDKNTTLSILKGNGDGTFQPAVTQVLWGGFNGSGGDAIAAGDFGTGQVDLAVANFSTAEIMVLHGNGDATFTPAGTYSVGTGPEGIAAMDFNGDGIVDLAVNDLNDNTVALLVGKGDGTFIPVVNRYTDDTARPFGWVTWGYPAFIAAGDLSGDGKPDIVVTNLIEGAVTVLRNTTVTVPLTGVVSRKVHGSAGPFDIDLTTGHGIECRSGGANGSHRLVFTFVNALTSVGGASVISGTGTVSSGAIGSDPHQYVVDLTGVTNGQVITVSLSNVHDAAANFSSAVSASMGVLLGDVNSSRLVDSGDVFLVRQQIGQNANPSNFREDVNASGVIDSGDVFLTRQQTGTSLP